MPLSLAPSFPFFTKYEQAFKISGVLQFFILLITSTGLDGGEVFRFMLLAAAAYWCMVAIIMLRRNGHATPVDQFLIKWGYSLAIILTALISAIVPFGLLRHR